MPAYEPDPDHLFSFAAVLSDLLPGTWTCEQHLRTAHEDQFVLTAEVWDMDQVAEAIACHPLKHHVVLTRADDSRRLFLMAHPRHDDEFLIAAMAPAATPSEAFRGVREPDGIAVPADPEHAAEAVITGLLPRYEAALAQVQHDVTVPAPSFAEDEVLVLTWNDSGDLTASVTREEVGEILTANGFVHDPDKQTYVLAGDDTFVQAQHGRAVGTRLAALGIGLQLRLPASHPGPATTPVATARPASARPTRAR
ncbi:hypothetical protein [Streptomyces sp. NPDC093225]|uniref:hypothetical protein n=1 Tax=Streptomyces sp. NPDC093225 TaxID=3366034 RepID=UPI0038201CE7